MHSNESKIFLFFVISSLTVVGVSGREPDSPDDFASGPDVDSQPVYAWPKNRTRDVKRLIHHGRNTTLIHPRDLCYPEGRSADLVDTVVVVLTYAGNFRERQAIRKSWALVCVISHISK